MASTGSDRAADDVGQRHFAAAADFAVPSDSRPEMNDEKCASLVRTRRLRRFVAAWRAR